MKTIVKALVLPVIAGGLLFISSPARAQVSVSVGVQVNAPSDFYAPLTPEGAWVDYGTYGRCWHPSGVAADWRPYCNGTWVWTDCGWYWQSSDPWAWACYHYGSWAFDPDVGWVWMPGTEWAPAWVTWRMGGNYIGWAPCGPDGGAPAASAFVLVDSHHFNGHITPSNVIINNTTIINQTRVYAGPRTETRTIGSASQRVAVNEGPGVAAFEKVTGKKYTAKPVQDVDQKTRVPENMKAPRNPTPERALPPATKAEPRSAPSTQTRENVRTPETPQPESRPANLPPGDLVPNRNVKTPHDQQAPATERAPQAAPNPPDRENVRTPANEQPEQRPKQQPSGDMAPNRTVEPSHEPAPKAAPATRPAAPQSTHVAQPPPKEQEQPKGAERPAPDDNKDKDHNQ